MSFNNSKIREFTNQCYAITFIDLLQNLINIIGSVITLHVVLEKNAFSVTEFRSDVAQVQ